MRPNEFTTTQQPDARRASLRLRRVPRSLGSFIAGFKASVTSRAGRELKMTGVWQRNYYEHIVRNDRELIAIRQYITANPVNWKIDRDNLENLRKHPPPERVDEYLEDIQELVSQLENQE